jgi:phosphate transport system ATP-binding protein
MAIETTENVASPTANVSLGEHAAARKAALGEVAIATKDVGVFYDKNQALRNVSLTFHHGEVAALIGPSGCGKSTYLRCLNLMNLEIPHCRIVGSISYHGADIVNDKINMFDLRKSIGMVFQQPNPFRKSIYDNVALAISRHGMAANKADLDERVERALRAAVLWDEVKDDLGKSAYALSGGQQQRLCIARTLALDPDVLLMDEPCSALDPIATRAIEDTARSIADSGISVIIVTHNMQQAARVSDTTSFFYLGEMVETGPTERIFSNPSDDRLKGYISGQFG